MDFSKMRHRITFLKPAGQEINDFDESVPKYEDFMTVWACVEPKTGREYDEAQKLRAETTYNIMTRYFADITAEMKIRHNNKLFAIESVLNIGGRNQELQIVAFETDTFGKETAENGN